MRRSIVNGCGICKMSTTHDTSIQIFSALILRNEPLHSDDEIFRKPIVVVKNKRNKKKKKKRFHPEFDHFKL